MIHNDFRLDNVVLARDDPLRIVGVLDWEMATLGDPLMDLAGALAYWIQDDDDAAFRDLRRQPSHLPGMLTRQEMVELLQPRGWGCSVTPEQWRFYEVFGLFRLGVIAQQIYYRYHHGQTTNEAYARFLPMVQLPRRALQPADRRGRSVSVLLLVRHGQASFGAADYDELSALGEEQSRLLGASLAARGVRPDVVLRGSMQRHRQTADGRGRGGRLDGRRRRGRRLGRVRPPRCHAERAGAVEEVEGESYDDRSSVRFDATIDRWTVGAPRRRVRRELPDLPGPRHRARPAHPRAPRPEADRRGVHLRRPDRRGCGSSLVAAACRRVAPAEPGWW